MALLLGIVLAWPAGARAADEASAIETARAAVAGGDIAGAIAGVTPYVTAHPADTAADRLLGDLYFRVPD